MSRCRGGKPGVLTCQSRFLSPSLESSNGQSFFQLDFITYMFENVSYPRIQTPTGCGRVLLQEPGIRCCPEIAEVALELEDLGLPARTPAGRNARSLGGFGAEFLGGLGDFGGVH